MCEDLVDQAGVFMSVQENNRIEMNQLSQLMNIITVITTLSPLFSAANSTAYKRCKPVVVTMSGERVEGYASRSITSEMNVAESFKL